VVREGSFGRWGGRRRKREIFYCLVRGESSPSYSGLGEKGKGFRPSRGRKSVNITPSKNGGGRGSEVFLIKVNFEGYGKEKESRSSQMGGKYEIPEKKGATFIFEDLPRRGGLEDGDADAFVYHRKASKGGEDLLEAHF